jgi:hypothetical protein
VWFTRIGLAGMVPNATLLLLLQLLLLLLINKISTLFLHRQSLQHNYRSKAPRLPWFSGAAAVCACRTNEVSTQCCQALLM